MSLSQAPAGTLETCDTAGILNTAVNFAASLAVNEALKLLVGAKDKMRRTLLARDLWTNQQSEDRTRARPGGVCGMPGEGLPLLARRRQAANHPLRPQLGADP